MHVVANEAIPAPPPMMTYDIMQLTEQEAQALMFVCGNIMGNSKARNLTDKIYVALKQKGVQCDGLFKTIGGCLYVEDKNSK